MLRGINRQIIFEDEEDNEKFIEIIKEYKELCGYKIYGYCLMGNHIHMIIKEEKEEIAQIMKRIAGKYVYWYNTKYQRTGHLFQDRFKSEPIETEKYFFTVLRYVHQNPVKAKLTQEIGEYKYSSYNEYVTSQDVVDTEYAFSMIDINGYKEYHKEISSDKCLDITESRQRVTDEEAKKIMKRLSKCENSTEFQNLEITKRNKLIKKFKSNGISIRQINRLTGVSKTIAEKC